MNPSRVPEKAEVVKLGAPGSGEVTITVDPSRAGTPFAAGTQMLQPRAEIPVHRQLDKDTVLFVHKGQGRIILNEQAINVVPGMMFFIPRGAWHGVRNTGTGALQIAWMSAPPGLEVFFRDLSQLGASPSAEAIQEVAQRHRIEIRPATEAPEPAAPRRSRSSRGRRRRGGRRAPPKASSAAPASTQASRTTSTEASRTTSTTPAGAAGAGGRRRRRHRGGGRRGRSAPSAATQGRPAPASGTSPAPRPSPPAPRPSPPAPRPSPPARSGTDRSRAPRRGYRSRVKEVYMNGRWVRVEGEGPVIATPGDNPPPAPD